MLLRRTIERCPRRVQRTSFARARARVFLRASYHVGRLPTVPTESYTRGIVRGPCTRIRLRRGKKRRGGQSTYRFSVRANDRLAASLFVLTTSIPRVGMKIALTHETTVYVSRSFKYSLVTVNIIDYSRNGNVRFKTTGRDIS